MKKLILLLLLSPLFGYSQEMPIAWKVGGVWVVSADVQNQAQYSLDSVSSGTYTVDTTFVIEDSLVQVGFSDGSIKYTDYISGRIDSDTIYTQPAMYSCSNTCKNLNECTAGYCYKTTDCKCSCSGDGGCTSVNLAIFSGVAFGAVQRERILISNGHEIPTE